MYLRSNGQASEVLKYLRDVVKKHLEAMIKGKSIEESKKEAEAITAKQKQSQRCREEAEAITAEAITAKK
jgi:uncharacterized glyoxalase superfamily protein PhnB